MRSFFFPLLIFFVPVFSHAAVIVNEVAWMGTTNSANDEWIELYNTSQSAVSLDGWILTDGIALDIALSGTLGAGEYAVLERTDDTSAAGDAFLVYTGALANTGATLQLRRADSGIEDQVAGGENWENIGGDNTTKETAQYTESGWVTGEPTPGSKNVSYSPPPVEEEEEEDETETETEDKTTRVISSGKKLSEKTYLVLPDWTLELELTAPKYAYVHQPVTFTIEPSGISDLLLKSVQYTWNMGDLTVARGREVVHQYEYPGTYVVVVDGTFKRHSASIRHEITVLPVAFSLTKNKNSDLQISNDSKYEVDLSGYSIRSDKTIVFPEDTILLPNATLTISKERLGSGSYAWLMDQEHAVVASTMATAPSATFAVGGTQVPDAAAEKPVAFLPPQTEQHVAQPESNFRFADENATTVDSEILNPDDFVFEPNEKEEGIKNAALVNEAQLPIKDEKLPYFGLAGVLSLGILALYAARVR